MSKSVAYFNNCWFTNIGEAFIDIGTMKILNDVFGKENCQLGAFSDMTQWYVDHYRFSGIKSAVKGQYQKKMGNNDAKQFYPLDYLKADYVVAAGMFATEESYNNYFHKGLQKARENGSKIVLLGIGGLNYNDNEKRAFTKILEDIQPELMITRDNVAYESYRDFANCVSGIDNALWVKDEYFPKGMSKKPYELVTFNYTEEPTDLSIKQGANIIRPYHFPFLLEGDTVKRDYLMVSDSPYDYLTLYANAEKVHTDLVHATLISIGYGTPVKYFKYDGRSACFDSINGLSKDENGFFIVDEIKLQEQKDKLMSQIKQVMNK